MKVIHTAHRVAGAAVAISRSAARAQSVEIGVIKTLSGPQAAWGLMHATGSGRGGPADPKDAATLLMD